MSRSGTFALAVVVLGVLAACSSSGDADSSGPAKQGSSASYSDAWGNEAEQRCTIDGFLERCGFNSSAREDDVPAADAQASNFNIGYEPSEDDPDGSGWSTVRDFASSIGCDVPEERPTGEFFGAECASRSEESAPQNERSVSGRPDTCVLFEELLRDIRLGIRLDNQTLIDRHTEIGRSAADQGMQGMLWPPARDFSTFIFNTESPEYERSAADLIKVCQQLDPEFDQAASASGLSDLVPTATPTGR